MDSQRVFIGVYKDTNQESLFYRKDNGLFQDLIQNRYVFIDELESTLVPYDNIIKQKSIFKGSIIRLYNYDRMQEISLNRVFIGNSYVVTEILDRKFFGVSSILTTFNTEELDDCILLYSKSSYLTCSDFIGIENNKCYKYLFCPKKGEINAPLRDLKPASLELDIHDPVIEKRELLKKYRAYKKGGNL